MYMLCVTGSVAWFWGDVCAPQVCLEGNFFTVCGDLHAILCAVKRQASVVHRPCFIFCHWRAALLRKTGLQQGHWRAGFHGKRGRTSKDGRSLLEDGSSMSS